MVLYWQSERRRWSHPTSQKIRQGVSVWVGWWRGCIYRGESIEGASHDVHFWWFVTELKNKNGKLVDRDEILHHVLNDFLWIRSKQTHS